LTPQNFRDTINCDAERERPSVIASLCSSFALPSPLLIGGSSCSRPRSFAVVSLLILSLLLAPPDARAGTYAFSGYTLTSGSGNTATYTPNNYPTAADSASAFTHYGGSAPETFSVVANDKITAAFTWQPTNGDSTADPPPSSAIIQQTSSVSWSGGVTGNPPPPTGACATGLPASVSTYTTGTLSKSGGGTYYFVQSQPGSSFTVDCTPTASSSGSSGSPGSGSHSDVRINYSVSASLNTPPFGVQQQSGWTWNVSGTTFQDWGPSSPLYPNASYFIGGYGPANQATTHWYWNDPGPNPTPETVTCTATVTPTDGKSAPFSVTAAQKVTVQVPAWRASGIGSYMQVNTKAPHDPEYELWGSMDWTATVATPPQPAFGTGSLELVQLVTSDDSYTTYTNPVQNRTDPFNGITGLDTACPLYGHVSMESGPPYMDNDNPGGQLTSSGSTLAGSAVQKGTFIDYLMYRPPGSDVKWVPLASFLWSLNGNATVSISGNWADYVTVHLSDSAGTVTPSVTTPFKPWNTHPSWTQIIGYIAY